MAWTAEWCEVQSSPGWCFSKEGEAFMGTSPQPLPGLQNELLCPQPPLPHPFPDLSNYIALCKSRSHLLPVEPTLSGSLSSSQQTRASVKSVFVYWGSYVSNKYRSAWWKMYSVLWNWSHCPPSSPTSLSQASLNPEGWTETPEKKTSFTRDWIVSQESNTFLPLTLWCSRQFHTMACNMIYMSPLVYQLDCPLFHFIFW